MRVALTLSLLALVACESPPLAPSSIDGDWVAPPSVPGSVFFFYLTQVADSVSGQGHYSIEAGRVGTLTVHGHYVAPVVTLALSYDSGVHQTFEGRVEGSQMVGTVTDSAGHSSARVFIRYGVLAHYQPAFLNGRVGTLGDRLQDYSSRMRRRAA